MELITYFVNGKKKTTKAKVLTNPLQKTIGLMFQKNPKPLFFTSNIQTYNPITSIFCKPFTAIWLDKNMHATKILKIKKWKLHIPGNGKHLLEIPMQTQPQKTLNRKSPSTKHTKKRYKGGKTWEK
jgi:uncharacterized membrane protein (UPF0127 family)